MTMTDPRTMADAIRFLSIDAIERVGEGHPGTPLGSADTATALFTRHLIPVDAKADSFGVSKLARV